MLDDFAFRRWCDALGLSSEARAQIAQIRSSRPSRRVRSTGSNVSGAFASHKMGQSIQFESHLVELPGVVGMEYSPDTLEFYDQPPRIKLNYLGPDERNRGHLHTLDFFVLDKDGAGWDEWKPEKRLVELAAKNPHFYHRAEDGRWRCPPGEAFAAQYGLRFRVRTDADIDWVWTRNILFLADYLRATNLTVERTLAAGIVDLIEAQPALPLLGLIRGARALGAKTDDVYILLVAGRFYVDLRAVPLRHAAQVRVFRDEALARAYRVILRTDRREVTQTPGVLRIAPNSELEWDECRWTIANVGATEITLIDRQGRPLTLPQETLGQLVGAGKVTGLTSATPAADPALERLLRASPGERAEAVRRHEALHGDPEGSSPSRGPSARTLRRYRQREREAERAVGTTMIGLLPDFGDRGNREERYSPEAWALVDKAVAWYEGKSAGRGGATPGAAGEDGANPAAGVAAPAESGVGKRRSKKSALGYLTLLGQEQSIAVPGYKALVQAIKARPKHEQEANRSGSRAAYPYSPRHRSDTPTMPRHGDRPWAVGHIDHTPLDDEMVDSETGQNLGRPWVTTLLDANTRRLPVAIVHFDPPSYRTCFLVFRECVRRHGRLFDTFVIDGGPEFGSNYFGLVSARYRTTVKRRPRGKPRAGSVEERAFDTMNTQFAHQLQGTTTLMKQIRLVTKVNNPKELALWTLPAVRDELENWRVRYNAEPHAGLGGLSPDQAHAVGEERSGEREHMLIPYDETFRTLTMPTTPKGTARVQESTGVKINYINYWNPVFAESGVAGTDVPVVFDSYDIGTALAFVKKRWVKCQSEHYLTLRWHSERELHIVTEELRARDKAHNKQFHMSARRLAESFLNLEGRENVLRQQRRDAEARGSEGRPARPPVATAEDTPPAPALPTAVVVAEIRDLEEYE